MDLTSVIRKPVISDKAYGLNHRLGKLVLEIHPDANKPLVKEAVEKLFNVKVKSVRILIKKGKLKRFKNKLTFKCPNRKRALITLQEGFSIEALSQPGVAANVESVTSGKKKTEDKVSKE